MLWLQNQPVVICTTQALQWPDFVALPMKEGPTAACSLQGRLEQGASERRKNSDGRTADRFLFLFPFLPTQYSLGLMHLWSITRGSS